MPDAKIILIVAAVAAVLLAAGALWKSGRAGGPMVEQPHALPKMRGSLDAAARRRVSVEMGEEIWGLLEAGRRAEAVALVREASGWDAEEAERMLAKLEGLKKRLES